IEHRVQFYPVRRDTGLSVQEIKHSNARNRDRYVGRLEARRHVEPGIEFGPGVSYAVHKRAAASNTVWRWYLTYHSPSSAVAYNEMIVFVALQLVLRERGVYDPDSRLGWLHSIVGRDWIGRSQAPEISDCGLGR